MIKIAADPVGRQYATKGESDICELSLGASGLRAVVETRSHESDERIWVEYHFKIPRGFRFLDEGDLIPYWDSGVFTHGYHLFEITSGGWFSHELQIPGMVSVSEAIGNWREWFVCTSNGCLNVLTIEPPLVREFRRGSTAGEMGPA